MSEQRTEVVNVPIIKRIVRNPQPEPPAESPPAPEANANPQPNGQGSEPTQTTNETPQPASEEQDIFSPKFAAIARREKEFLDQQNQQRAQFQAERDQFEQQKSKLAHWENAEKALRNDPLGFLQARGITYEQLTQMALEPNSYRPPAPDNSDQISKLQQQIEQQNEERRKEREQREQEEQDRKAQQQLDEYQQTINNHVSSGAEKYELIQHMNAQKDVLDLTVEYYQNTGQLIPVDRACQMVEEKLEKQARTFLGAKKFAQQQPTSPPPTSPSAPAPTSQSVTKTDPFNTISSNLSGASNPLPTNESKPMDEKDAMDRAMERLRWK